MRCILLMVVGAAFAVGFVLGNDTFDTADYLGELSCGGGRLTANDYDIDPIGDVDFVKFYVPCSMTVTIEFVAQTRLAPWTFHRVNSGKMRTG